MASTFTFPSDASECQKFGFQIEMEKIRLSINDGLVNHQLQMAKKNEKIKNTYKENAPQQQV